MAGIIYRSSQCRGTKQANHPLYWCLPCIHSTVLHPQDLPPELSHVLPVSKHHKRVHGLPILLSTWVLNIPCQEYHHLISYVSTISGNVRRDPVPTVLTKPCVCNTTVTTYRYPHHFSSTPLLWVHHDQLPATERDSDCWYSPPFYTGQEDTRCDSKCMSMDMHIHWCNNMVMV